MIDKPTCATFEAHRWTRMAGGPEFCRICGVPREIAEADESGAPVRVACPHDKGGSAVWVLPLAGSAEMVLCTACWRAIVLGVLEMQTALTMQGLAPERAES